MKSVIRGVYIALVGLIVFTGALFIAQGALTGDQKPPIAESPASQDAESPLTDDAASPAPRQRIPEYQAPDGPALFI